MSAKAKRKCASGVAKGARVLFPKSALGRGQKSLLLCHGRYASPRLRRWQIGAAILRYLRIPPIVPCDFGRYGGGRDLKGIADFANGKRCAKNFGNALDLD